MKKKNQTWYGLYARQKLYKKNNIEGSMIWGCQYDAMLRWLQKSEIDVTANIGDNKNKGKDQLGNEVGTTGIVETDKVNNIYDLYGNGFEWTLEACVAVFRVYRGGRYNNSYSLAGHHQDSPDTISSTYSTRATLYIP